MNAHDLRQTWRSLWKNPGFTLIAVLTLAIGIGANTAMASALVDSAEYTWHLPFILTHD